MASVRPWPELLEEDKWLIELMEAQFDKADMSAAELRARAKELYAQAEHAEAGQRDVLLALADRYEEAATVRTARR
jgi:hypothetical protein